MSLTTGGRLEPYEVLAKLGEGGMGAAYRARDTKLNRDVALKVLLPTVASDAERLARFQREAEVLAWPRRWTPPTSGVAMQAATITTPAMTRPV